MNYVIGKKVNNTYIIYAIYPNLIKNWTTIKKIETLSDGLFLILIC